MSICHKITWHVVNRFHSLQVPECSRLSLRAKSGAASPGSWRAQLGSLLVSLGPDRSEIGHTLRFSSLAFANLLAWFGHSGGKNECGSGQMSCDICCCSECVRTLPLRDFSGHLQVSGRAQVLHIVLAYLLTRFKHATQTSSDSRLTLAFPVI